MYFVLWKIKKQEILIISLILLINSRLNLTCLGFCSSTIPSKVFFRCVSTTPTSRCYLFFRRWRWWKYDITPWIFWYGSRRIITFFTIRHHLCRRSTLPTIVSFAVQSKLHLTFVTRWLQSGQVSCTQFFLLFHHSTWM